MAPSKGDDEDKVFGPLKEEWLQQEGYSTSSRKAGETKLITEIRGWLNDFLQKMNDEDDSGAAQEGCKSMSETEEKKVCEFILKNLLKIWTTPKGGNTKEEINRKVKEYVQCAILKLWSTFYLSDHCDKENAVSSAFAKIKELGTTLSGGVVHEECDYSEVLEPMKVLEQPMIQHIGTAIEKNTKVMELINKNPTGKQGCEEKRRNLTKLGLSSSNTGSIRTKNMAPTASAQHTAEGGKKITAQQLHFITNLITEWMKAHSMAEMDNFEKSIWDELKTVFTDMMNNIQDDGEKDKESCASLNKDWNKELCKILIRMFLWMDGLKQEHAAIGPSNLRHTTWTKRENEIRSKQKELHSYYRCLLGKVTILSMLGDHCNLREVASFVNSKMPGIRTSLRVGKGNELCQEVDVGSLVLGGKFMSGQIKEWIEEYKRDKDNREGLSEVKKGESKLHRLRAEGQNENYCPKQQNLDRATLSNLEIKVNDGENLSLDDGKDTKTSGKEELNKVLKEAVAKAKGKDNFWTDSLVKQLAESLNKKFQDHKAEVQRRKAEAAAVSSRPGNLARNEQSVGDDPPLSPTTQRGPVSAHPQPPQQQGIECTDKAVLCERVTCVAERWRANRERSTFWDKDVQKRLGDLSSAMTNGGTTDHASCNDITVTDGSSVESNKQACNYIVRGLEHIYRIQKEGDRTNAENIRKSDDNQLFTRTMNCVLLNAYADRLEQQSPCSQNEGVKHAFNAGNQLWNTICKNNGDTNCVPCKREPNFDCEIEYKNKSYNDKTEVKDEVEKLLQQNGQITNSLSTISSTNNTLCQRVQCVTVKWFKDRIYSEYRKQDWCTFWRENDVGKVLRDLSTAMKNGSKTDDKYCDDITVTDGTSNPQANKKACNFIARGLEDIYKIEPYGGWTGNGAEEKKKKNNNQQFYRTIGCAFLNVYADMLEKLPCVSNDVVQKAFGKSDQIKTNSTTCKTDPNCVTCTREKNLKCTLSVEDNLLNKVKGTSCEGDKQNIHKKLGKMLNPNENGDPKVRQALKEINNICPPPPSVKPATAAKPVEAPAAAAPSGRSDGDTEPVPVLPPGVPSGPQQADSNKAQPGKTPQIKADKVDISMPEAGGQAHIEITPVSTPGPRNGMDNSPDPFANDPFASGSIDAAGPTVTVTANQSPGYSGPGPTHAATNFSGQPTGSSGPGGVPGAGVSPESVGGNSQGGAPGSDSKGPGALVPGVPPAGVPGAPGDGVNGSPGQQPPPPPPPPATSESTLGATTTTRHVKRGRGGATIPIAKPVVSKIDNLSDLLTPYLPTIPVLIGTSVISYLLWKYFFLGKRRKRHRRAHQVSGSPPLGELLAHVDDQADGPRAYTLVKERRQRKSTPTGITKRPKKQGVGHRMIIDIHLEVLDECQKSDLHSTKEDFLKIIVEEFMGSEFIKEEKTREEVVPKEQVPSLYSGFRV